MQEHPSSFDKDLPKKLSYIVLRFVWQALSSTHTVQEVYKVASKNNAYTQFWSQYSSVRSTHSLPAKDVDGWLVTGASQDHFVVFHHLTVIV